LVCRRGYVKKLRALIAFLLFREEVPKHKVWRDFNAIHLGLVLPLSVVAGIGLIVVGYISLNIIGFMLASFAAAMLPLEILHIVFDR